MRRADGYHADYTLDGWRQVGDAIYSGKKGVEAAAEDRAGDMVGVESFSSRFFTLKSKRGKIKICDRDSRHVVAEIEECSKCIELTEEERERVRSILVMEAL